MLPGAPPPPPSLHQHPPTSASTTPRYTPTPRTTPTPRYTPHLHTSAPPPAQERHAEVEGEEWVAALKGRDYDELALSQRVALLSALCHLAIDCPTVRSAGVLPPPPRGCWVSLALLACCPVLWPHPNAAIIPGTRQLLDYAGLRLGWARAGLGWAGLGRSGFTTTLRVWALPSPLPPLHLPSPPPHCMALWALSSSSSSRDTLERRLEEQGRIKRQVFEEQKAEKRRKQVGSCVGWGGVG